MDVQTGGSMELVNCVDDDDDDNDDELDDDDDGEDTHTPFKFGQKDAEQ